MFDWKNFPWTDFQDLNLDWILRKIKELKTVDLPALDEKIDNVYQYIEENLPEIISQIATVVIDVKAAGAVGDGVTDDSNAIKNALSMGSVLYFPEGTYRLKEIDVNKSVCLIGDHATLIPFRRHENTNQVLPLFTFYDAAIIKGFEFTREPFITPESGTKYLPGSHIIAENSSCIYMEDCHIYGIYEGQHISVSGTAGEYRQGIFAWLHNCANVMVHNCKFGDYAGEELVQISQDRSRYERGFVFIDSNAFENRNTRGTGSAINVLGGTLFFTNNGGRNYNYVYTDRLNGGSLFNLAAAYAVVNNNMFYDCLGGDYFDLTEAYNHKQEIGVVTNNVLRGEMRGGFRGMCRQLIVKNNVIEAETPVRTFTINATPSSGIPYHVDDNTLYTFESFVLEGNEFICANNPFTETMTDARHPIYFGQTRDDQGTRALTGYVKISNNTFKRNSDAVSWGCIYLNSPSDNVHIFNNLFIGTGVSRPTVGDARTICSGGDIFNCLNISYNILDMNEYTDSLITYLFTGNAVCRTGSYLFENFNMGIGSNITKYYISGHPDINYNVNIT